MTMLLRVLSCIGIMTTHIAKGDDIFNVTNTEAPSSSPSVSMAPSPAPLFNCTICLNGTKPNDLSAKYSVPGIEAMSCEEAYERGPILASEQSCANYQAIGRNICSCEKELPTNTDCTLCEDENEGLPIPTLAGSKVGDKTKSCAEIDVDAKRDLPEACPVYQATYGILCGCNNTGGLVGKTCQICGADQTLQYLNTTLRADGSASVSCGLLIFEANLPSADGTCDAYKSNYSKFCCKDVPVEEGTLPPSDPSSATMIALKSFHVAFGVLLFVASIV